MWNQVQQALNESLNRVITGVASMLPGVIALVVALLVSAVLAAILSSLVRRSLRGIGFDERIVRWGGAGVLDWSPSKSPTRLVSRVLFWVIMFIGFLVGIAAFDATLTSRLVLRMFAYFPNVIAAGLLLLAGGVLARYLSRSVLIGAVNMRVHYARLLSAGVKWLVLVLTAAMVLEHLGIGGDIVRLAFAILFGGIVLALALAVGLGSKDLVSRSLERQTNKTAEEEMEEEPFRHL
jgi:Mechanosensitive ion channel, conserved TM helix